MRENRLPTVQTDDESKEREGIKDGRRRTHAGGANGRRNQEVVGLWGASIEGMDGLMHGIKLNKLELIFKI